MTAAGTDRIERSIHLKAPRSRVWRALTDATEFGRWFGVDLSGSPKAEAGATLRGPITSEGWRHVIFEAVVDAAEPETRYALRWHPYAVEPGVDYSHEPTTLIVFTLEDDAAGGTLLTVVESGFDAIPAARRAKAFQMNASGWTAQMQSIERHLGA